MADSKQQHPCGCGKGKYGRESLCLVARELLARFEGLLQAAARKTLLRVPYSEQVAAWGEANAAWNAYQAHFLRKEER